VQLTAKKIRCPLCGAKNDVDATRCQICTRPLGENSSKTEAIYQEALWSRSINQAPRARTRILPVLAFLVIAGLAANYLYFGFGPSWAHLASAARPGADWLQVDDPAYRVDLPGTPQKFTADTPAGQYATRWVWVDDRWHAIRDSTTVSADALRDAGLNFSAALIVGVGPALTDPRQQSAEVVAAIQPGPTVDGLTITERQHPDFGVQYDVTGTYKLWPDRADSGVVQARVTQYNGSTYVAVIFFKNRVSEGLSDRLLSEFVPVGAPGYSRAGS
jgi:hypothetical protein